MRIGRREMLAGTAAMAAVVLHRAFAADGFLELTARAASLKLAGDRGPASDLIGFDGSVPGPELRFTQGLPVRIRFRNGLDEPATIHWHGIRLANAMDGVPGLTQQAVPPGGSFDYEFTPPDAGTFWYHAHFSSWKQMARGLFGALVIDEPEPAFSRDHDHALVLTDWRLDAGGKFDAASLGSLMDWSHAGRIGNLITVNGRVQPELALAPGRPHRLRLINTSTARVLKLALPGAEVIARDGQTLGEALPAAGKVVLGPAQRVDLAVTLSPGERLELHEVSAKPETVMALAGSAPASAAFVPRLRAARLPEPDLTRAISVEMSMQGGALGKLNGTEIAEMHAMDMPAGNEPLWAFNEVSGMSATPLAEVARGTTIRFDMRNDTAWDHAIHLHGHHFRVISRQGIATGDTAWLDTLMIAPGERLQAAFVADNPGDWMIHCHMLEHSASGMDTWFRVA